MSVAIHVASENVCAMPEYIYNVSNFAWPCLISLITCHMLIFVNLMSKVICNMRYFICIMFSFICNVSQYIYDISISFISKSESIDVSITPCARFNSFIRFPPRYQPFWTIYTPFESPWLIDSRNARFDSNVWRNFMTHSAM